MSLTINGATNTLTAASGLAIAGNTAITGTLSATTSISANGAVVMTVGSSPAITFTPSSGATKSASIAQAANVLYINDSGVAERWNIALATGNVTMTGNLVMASGKGIDFSATANGSGTTTSEVLSDYEEGTWTPVVRDATAGNEATAAITVGTYTKIGRQVTCWCSLSNINRTGLTAGNVAFVTGLPFTPAGSNPFYKACSAVYAPLVTWTTSSIIGFIADTETNISFREMATNGTPTNVLVSQLTSTTADLHFSITYNV